MKKTFIRCLLTMSAACTVLAFTGSAFAVDGEFRMRGLAMHQDTGRNIYLGAIHLGKDTWGTGDLTAAGTPRMMEYRVIARRTSIRSMLGNILLQSELANGAPPSSGTLDFADELLSAVTGSLYAGDSFQISHNEGGRISATLNGQRLVDSLDAGIFDYLLQGWIGENGPSTAFRNSIRKTAIDKSLLTAYDAHTPSEERVAAIVQWADKEEPEVQVEAGRNEDLAVDLAPTADDSVVAAEPVNSLAAQPEETVAAAPTAAPIPEPTTGEASTPPIINEEDVATATLLETMLDEAGTGAEDQLMSFEAVAFEQRGLESEYGVMRVAAASSISGEYGATQGWSFEGQTRRKNQTAEDIIAEEPFDILSLDVTEYSYRLASFNTSIMKLVYGKIQYPRRAVRRDIQGQLELDITILANGSLVGVAIGSSSGYSILDAAAVEAAEKALNEAPLGEVDPVAVAEYGVDGNVIIPVPVNFILQ